MMYARNMGTLTTTRNKPKADDRSLGDELLSELYKSFHIVPGKSKTVLSRPVKHPAPLHEIPTHSDVVFIGSFNARNKKKSLPN